MNGMDSPENTLQNEYVRSFYTGRCASISGRSTLTYEIGKHEIEGTLHLRISSNTGEGVWCKDWVVFQKIDAIVLGAQALTAKSFYCLHLGRSINTGGFVLAALRDLGLIRPNGANTRLHEHVPMATLELVLLNPVKPKDRGYAAAKAHRKAKEGA